MIAQAEKNNGSGRSLQNNEPKKPRRRTGGPKTPEGKARALANLMPPIKPGETRNPAGRPRAAGLSIREWLNEMQDWPREKIETVMNDADASASKRAAARCWLDAFVRSYTSSGAPVAGSDFDRICDRTTGKATQPIQMTGANGGPIQHTFDHERYAELFRRRIAGDVGRIDSANGN